MAIAYLQESPFLASKPDLGPLGSQSGKGRTAQLPDQLVTGSAENGKDVKEPSAAQKPQPATANSKECSIIEVLASLFVKIFQTVVEAAQQYAEEQGRLVFVTPARFSEGLLLFERLITEKSAHIQSERE